MQLSGFVLLASVLAVSCDDGIWNTDLATRNLYALGHANNYFGLNLHRKLSIETDGNVFFSPFSVTSVLAMLYSGARGDTAMELKKALGYRKLNDTVIFSSFFYYLTQILEKIDPKFYAVNSVSAMVFDSSFPVLEEYKNDMRYIFQAYVQGANIAEESAAVADRINTWAKIKTRGAISDLADVIPPETTLFLASAAYFKGAWKVKFDPKDTKYHPFYNEGERANASEVLMMHTHATFRYFDGTRETFTAVELFYEGRNMSMVIYLPKHYGGLSDLEEDMTASKLSYVRRQMYFTKLHLTMPKFELDYRKSLPAVLKDLGMSKIFHGADADLSGMIAEGATLALSDVQHAARIQVDEQGTVASAVTRAIMTKSMPMPTVEFKVDHPFFFSIFDSNSGMALFMGRITKL